MKIRPVVVWFRKPITVSEEERKVKLEFEANTEATPVPGGNRFISIVKFVTASGDTLYVPEEVIAWIEFGAETDRALPR